MSDYTIRRLDEVDDAFGGQYPGSMRFMTEVYLTAATCASRVMSIACASVASTLMKASSEIWLTFSLSELPVSLRPGGVLLGPGRL